MTWAACFQSPLGAIRIFGAGSELRCLAFTADNSEPPAKAGPCRPVADWLHAYFSGERPEPCALALSPAGSRFCQAVWLEIARIPYGEVRSYGDIAEKLGTSPRAVGQAAGKNPIALLIPCHRIVGASGRLTGYAYGLWRKEWLLRHENPAGHWEPTTKA